jgi:hypothetical protein
VRFLFLYYQSLPKFSHHQIVTSNIICCPEQLDIKYTLMLSRKLRLTTVGDLPRCQRDTPLSIKVGTKFHRKLAVAQSVELTCGLRDTEFVFLFEARDYWVCSVAGRCMRMRMRMCMPITFQGNSVISKRAKIG